MDNRLKACKSVRLFFSNNLKQSQSTDVENNFQTTSNYFKQHQHQKANRLTAVCTGAIHCVSETGQPFKHRNSVSHQTPQAFKRAKPTQTAKPSNSKIVNRQSKIKLYFCAYLC